MGKENEDPGADPRTDVTPVEEVLQAVVQMKDTLQGLAQDSGDLKEAQAQMKADLEDRFEKIEPQFTDMQATLQKWDEDHEKLNKSVFDVIMNSQSNALSAWGYSPSEDIQQEQIPLHRALYQPKTKWTRNRGWIRTGEAYEVPDHVMEMNDFIYLFGAHKSFMSQRKPDKAITYSKAVKSLETYNLFKYELERDSELRKALSASTAGEGQDFVPTGMSAQLIDDVRLQLKVAALFPSITMPAGSGSYEVPLRGARQTAYLVGEPTTDTASKITAGTTPSGKLTFAAKTHGLRMLFSYDIDEDSIIPIMPLVLEELRQAIVDGQESSYINGDIDTTHLDSDVTSAADIRKSFYGLRYHAGGSSGQAAVDISTLSTTNLRSIYKAQGRYGVNPADCAWITGISSFVQMLGLTEVLTMDKFGPQATVKSGQLADFDGRPVIVSEFMRQDLNTSGVYDGTTLTDTIILHVNTRAFWGAEKPGGILIETDQDIETQQNIAVASRRLDFKQTRAPGSDEETVGLGYSLTS